MIYLLYIVAFFIATSTHTRDLILGGFLPYTGKPLWANIYWTSLTLADPLAVVILLLSLRKGIVMYGVIIISDVIINLYFTMSLAGPLGIFNIFMLGQLAFLIVFALTWKRLGSVNDDQTLVEE